MFTVVGIKHLTGRQMFGVQNILLINPLLLNVTRIKHLLKIKNVK